MSEKIYVNPGKMVLHGAAVQIVNEDKQFVARNGQRYLNAMTTLTEEDFSDQPDKGEVKGIKGMDLLNKWLKGGQLRPAKATTKTVVEVQ